MPEIYRLARLFREQLLSREEGARRAIIQSYSGAWQAISTDLEGLVAYLVQSPDPITAGQLVRLDRYQQLMTQIEAQVTRFGGQAQSIVSQAQQGQIAAAREQARQMIEAGGVRVSRAFSALASGAVEKIVGHLADGNPIAAHIAKSFPGVQERVRQELVNGVAAGKNPKAVARKIVAALEPPVGKRGQGTGPLAVALRVARTEILRAHREASRETYNQHPDIVQGWIWLSARGTHVCAACLAMDGTTHPLSEPMGSHANCRCVSLPWLSGDPAPTDTGEAWLLKQSSEVQAEVLGRSAPDPAAAEALRAGRVKLSDFVHEKHDDTWGTTRTAKSLEQALASKAPAFRAPAGGWQPSVPDPRGMPSDQRVAQDTKRIVDFVAAETGSPSRWAGKVLFSSDPNADFLGKKLHPCPIEYHRDVLGDSEFYLVALEEALHSVSVLAPLPGVDLMVFEAMEESVVSACLEILKPKLNNLFANQGAATLNLPVRDSDYIKNMKALGKLRRLSGIDRDTFFFGLLRTPLANREEAIVKWISLGQKRTTAEVLVDVDIQNLLADVSKMP